MTPQELLEAAQVFVDYRSELNGYCDVIRKQAGEKLTAHILNTVKPDDDEPITREWLVDCMGFIPTAYWGEPAILDCDLSGLDFDIVFSDSGISYGSLNLPVVKTRGQLRQLLQLMGANQ